jgi:hypothetical protein
MEYILEIRFDDNNYNAIIHFVTTFTAKSDQEAKLLVDELVDGFNRRKVMVLSGTYTRIDNNPELRERQYEFYNFYISRATATIQIEQFVLENPDQTKSLVENLTNRFFNGENSTALIGKKYNIPVRVMDKKTRNPITADIFYCNIEHLIPKA